MSNNTSNSLLRAIGESMNVLRRRMELKQNILKRWEKTGLLNGLEVPGDEARTKVRKLNMAQLLENQILGVRESREGAIPTFLLESPTQTTGVGSAKEAWSNVAFPLVRKAFAETFAEELVSIQSIDMPTSYIFYLDYTYGTNKPENFNSPRFLYSQSDSLFGNVTAPGSPTGRWYGGTDYSYTRNYVSASNIPYTTSTVSWADVEYDPDLSASLAQLTKVFIYKTSFDAAEAAGAPPIDYNQPEAVLLTSGSAIKQQYRRFSAYDSSNQRFVFIISGTLAAAGSGSMPVVEYIRRTSQEFRGDFESGQVGVGEIPTLKINIVREEIAAQSRRLKTTWSEEAAQDFYAYQGIDIEAEFLNVMSKVITQEIDLMILNLIRNAAIDTMYWSRAVGTFVDKFTGSPVSGVTPTFYGTTRDWYQTLYERILDLSNLMHKRTLIGGATHLVVSPEVATILQSSGLLFGVSSGADVSQIKFSSGAAQFIGGLGSEWKVYKSPFVPTNEILLVRKGSDWLDTGFVYSPYVPLTFTDTLVDPNDFSLVRGALIRDAFKVVKPYYAARLLIKNINV